jgi:RNA polymerase sigma factor (TIGR02999 family)
MICPPDGDVTALLIAWSEGDESALDRLTPIVYEELRRLAHKHMVRERPGHTLQTTALANEAYLRLVDCRRMRFRDRAHFFAVSAQLIRRILIDYSRRRNVKRGAGMERISLDEAASIGGTAPADLVAVDDALKSLEKIDPRKGRVVELRFFGGLSVEETAEALDISPVTVVRDWNNAKVWLFRELTSRGANDA